MNQPTHSQPKPDRWPLRAAAEKIVRVLQEAGFAAYFAGGCVRDRLLGREPADYDIATSATPPEIARLFKRTRAVGQHFGVMLVLLGGHQVEVATFRIDAEYQDGRRPESVRFSTAQEDAQRRDFTINGLFYDPVRNQVVDYVDGQADLQAGILRAIGEARRRFAEDHLRLLRAVRFAARFDLEIEAETWAAMQQMGGNLAGVSPERVLEELEKIAAIVPASFAEKNRQRDDESESCADQGQRLMGTLAGGELRGKARALQLIHDGGLLAAVMPEYGAFTSQLPLAMALLSRFPAPCGLELMLAGWLGTARTNPHEPATRAESVALANMAEQVGERLRMSNRLAESLGWLLLHGSDLADEMELADLRLLRANPNWENLVTLSTVRMELTRDPAERVRGNLAVAGRYRSAPEAKPAPLLTGDMLIARGMKPGPQMGALLTQVYRTQLNEEIGTAEEGWALVNRLTGRSTEPAGH